jgi:hypothetical protein
MKIGSITIPRHHLCATGRQWFLAVVAVSFAVACRPQAVAATSATNNDEIARVSQRRQLLDDRVVIAVRMSNGKRSPTVAGLPGNLGINVLLYVPDWESEDNIAAFRVLTGEKLERRLSTEELKRVQSLFPEARLQSYVERRSQSPCGCDSWRIRAAKMR